MGLASERSMVSASLCARMGQKKPCYGLGSTHEPHCDSKYTVPFCIDKDRFPVKVYLLSSPRMDPVDRYFTAEQDAGYARQPLRQKREKQGKGSHARPLSGGIIALYVLWSLGSAVAVAAFAIAMVTLVRQENVAPSPTPTPGPAPAATPIASPVGVPMAVPSASPLASPIAPPIASPVAPPVAPPIASPIASPVTVPSSAPSGPITPVYQPRIGFSSYLSVPLAIGTSSNTSLIGWTANNVTYPGYYTSPTFNATTGRYTAPTDAVYLITLYIEVTIGPAVGNVFTTFTCYMDVSGVQSLFAQDGENLQNNQFGQYMLVVSTPILLSTGDSVGILCGASLLPATLQGNPNTRFGIERIAT